MEDDLVGAIPEEYFRHRKSKEGRRFFRIATLSKRGASSDLLFVPEEVVVLPRF
jgi:hypothetical protein